MIIPIKTYSTCNFLEEGGKGLHLSEFENKQVV